MEQPRCRQGQRINVCTFQAGVSPSHQVSEADVGWLWLKGISVFFSVPIIGGQLPLKASVLPPGARSWCVRLQVHLFRGQ